MADRMYALHLTPGEVFHVSASSVDLQGEHLVFVNSAGKLAALVLFELVVSWTVMG